MAWITVNGAHIEINEKGEAVGRLGKKLSKSSVRKEFKKNISQQQRGKEFMKMHKAKQAAYDARNWGAVSGRDLGFYR